MLPAISTQELASQVLTELEKSATRQTRQWLAKIDNTPVAWWSIRDGFLDSTLLAEDKWQLVRLMGTHQFNGARRLPGWFTNGFDALPTSAQGTVAGQDTITQAILSRGLTKDQLKALKAFRIPKSAADYNAMPTTDRVAFRNTLIQQPLTATQTDAAQIAFAGVSPYTISSFSHAEKEAFLALPEPFQRLIVKIHTVAWQEGEDNPIGKAYMVAVTKN